MIGKNIDTDFSLVHGSFRRLLHVHLRERGQNSSMPVSEQRVVDIISSLLLFEAIPRSFPSRLVISHRLTEALRAELPDYPEACATVLEPEGDTVIVSMRLSWTDPLVILLVGSVWRMRACIFPSP